MNITIAWGRFQPPHWEHAQLFKECNDLGGDSTLIFASRTCDKKKNPLSFEQKLYWLRYMFPNQQFPLINGVNTIFDAIKYTISNYLNVEKITLVVGADRFDEFDERIVPHVFNLNKDWNGTFVLHKTKHVDSIHSSTLRDLVAHGEYAGFVNLYRNHTDNLKEFEIGVLFDELREGMGLTSL